MNEVYIDVRGLGIEELFTTDFVSVEQLVACIEDLQCDIRNLKEQLEEHTPDPFDEWNDRRMTNGLN